MIPEGSFSALNASLNHDANAGLVRNVDREFCADRRHDDSTFPTHSDPSEGWQSFARRGSRGELRDLIER